MKKGCCGISGAVLGWPTLDVPQNRSDEALGWVNHPDGAEYTALGVTIPRLDVSRRATFEAGMAQYVLQGGNYCAVQEPGTSSDG